MQKIVRQFGLFTRIIPECRSTKRKSFECTVAETKIANLVTADCLNCQPKFEENVEAVNTRGEEAN